MAMVIGVVVFGIAVVIHHWWRNRNAIVTNWPILGTMPSLVWNIPRIHDFITELMTKSGGTFELKCPLFSNLNFVITCDPLNFQHIATTKFSNYPKGEEFREVFDVLGDGIINVDSDLWRLQRKMFQLWTQRHAKFDSFVANTLHRKVLHHLIPFLNDATETQIQVDLQETLQKTITFDNAIKFIFGLDLEFYSFKSSKIEYQKAFNEIQEVVFLRHLTPKSYWKLLRWLDIGTERKLRIARETFDEFIYQCISFKREQMSHINARDEEANLGLLTIYMEEKGKLYSDKFLRDIAYSFLAAARDTLTAGLCWFFWLVASHPDIEAKILDEMQEKLGGYCNNLDHYKSEELSKLVYLQAAIYETFRLYPPVPLNHKTPTNADVFPSGHNVNPKQMVLMSIYSVGRMEVVWGKDCLEFKPERWISEQGEFIYVPSHKFPIFHIGAKTCLGKDMALIQMKIMVLTILKNYRFHIVEGHPIRPALMVTMNMNYGLKIKVSKRSF